MRARVKDPSDWYLGLGLILVVLLAQLGGDCNCGVQVEFEQTVAHAP